MNQKSIQNLPSLRVAIVAGFCAVLIGLLGIASWALNLTWLRGFAFEALQMKPNTAVGFVAGGIATLLLTLGRNSAGACSAGRLLGVFCLSIGAVSGYGVLLGRELAVETFLVHLLAGPDSMLSGQMVFTSSINFILFGAAICTLDLPFQNRRPLSEWLATSLLVAPYTALVSYSHGPATMLQVEGMPLLTQMSPHTALAWIALAIALLAARPERAFGRVLFTPSSSGAMLRLVLTIALLLPVAGAWAMWWGGLYELYHVGFVSSVLTLLSTSLLIAVLWRSMKTVVDTEAELVRKLEEERRLEEKMRGQALELKRSNEALERFASVVSHDLKEPLRTVSLFLGMLRKTSEVKQDERSQEYIQTAIDGADRMKQLIDGLQQYSGVGKGPRTTQPVCLDSVMRQTQANLKALITEADATISCCPLPIVKVNEVLLNQLFQNLISNALKYREGRPCRIEIDCHRAHSLYTVVISDNGMGFDPRLSEKIFQPFQRLPAALKHPGAGLGLSTCRQIVQEHGGTIWATAPPEKGARFYFTLPVPAPDFLAQSTRVADAHVSI